MCEYMLYALYVLLTVHYYVMNNSTAMNLTSFPGLLKYESDVLGPVYGAGILFTIFLIIVVALSFIIDFINGVMVGAFVCTGLSLILSLPGIDIINPVVLYLFVAILGIAVLGNLLRGVIATW